MPISARIDATAFELRQIQEWAQILFHLVERPVVEFDAATVPDDAADFLADIDDEEIAGARHIDTHVERAIGVVAGVNEQLLERHEFEERIGAGVEHLIGEEGSIFVGGSAAIFLEPLFFVDAFVTDASKEVVVGFVSASFYVDPLDETLSDGELNGNGVEAPFFGVTLVKNFGDDFVEEGVMATMSGDNGEMAAPGGDGFSHFVEETLVLMQGEFVEFNVPAFAGESVWVGGKAIDATAIGELEDISRSVGFLVEDEQAEVEELDVKENGPVFTVLEV